MPLTKEKSPTWLRTLAAGLLLMAQAASADNLDRPVDLPNLVFVGRKVTPEIPAVQLPTLTFTGRQEAVLPPVQVPTLSFTGRGDPKGFDPVTTPPLNFKGKMPK